MKARAELWVKLKVTDLVVETAWLTLTEKLDFDYLRGLTKYSCWFMKCEGNSLEETADQLNRVITLDSTFTNQNKHKYSLIIEGEENKTGEGKSSSIAKRGDLNIDEDFTLRSEASSGKLYACDCFVTELESDKNMNYTDRISGRPGDISISEMRAGLVWRLIIEADSRNDAEKKAEEISVTRSRRGGLLLNPHYQDFEIISTVSLSERGAN
ncbi:MAG TPA: hypothetical protein VKO43_01505 [Candidatus Krumholzibacteriaceae bacterium]|nr:hypothetical protein [Candidatus Krumholzibacteriaceae bacterium]